MFSDGGAVPVPVLCRGGFARRGHVQVRRDEAVAIDRVSAFQFGDREGALARVQGAAPPRPRVSGDLAGVQADPADQQESVSGPPVRPVTGHRDLGIVQVDGIVPAVFADAVQQPPQRRDPVPPKYSIR